MTTTSSEAMNVTLLQRLLNFEPPTGDTLNTLIGGRLFIEYPGDKPTFPYGIARLLRDTDEDISVVREPNQYEVMLFANLRSSAGLIEQLADLCDMAMLDWVDSSSGLIFTRRNRTRDTLPPPPEPADREVVQMRLMYDVVIYPLYLNQLGE